ncbi:hypothetical protein QYE76_055496 [Lolium multiflorum]|uniref:Uncharacterized protein n=1 Tax=Lolium multiflorum TaxID=4521 RepID=A0AAD8T0H7_LOLMU|nr:hypothetical protein QYE76_055496 [Lolium multiflorum]
MPQLVHRRALRFRAPSGQFHFRIRPQLVHRRALCFRAPSGRFHFRRSASERKTGGYELLPPIRSTPLPQLSAPAMRSRWSSRKSGCGGGLARIARM